jgi:hypothetical protein
VLGGRGWTSKRRYGPGPDVGHELVLLGDLGLELGG